MHRALYLLFDEGYHGASSRGVVRVKLCDHFAAAHALARNDAERRFLERRVAACGQRA